MKILFLLCAIVLFSIMENPLHAEVLTFDRNAEADMKEYHIYYCTTGTTCTVLKSTPPQGIIPQVPLGSIPSFNIPNGLEGKIAATAVDTADNESALSIQVPFDAFAPVVPKNLLVK